MENTIISVKDITARYEKKTVLEKVSLEVKDKDYLGIIGPNGGGKTTLIRIILGMLQPAEGKVEYYSEGNKVNSITMG
jgi:zinc transport system ATP-binding protein